MCGLVDRPGQNQSLVREFLFFLGGTVTEANCKMVPIQGAVRRRSESFSGKSVRSKKIRYDSIAISPLCLSVSLSLFLSVSPGLSLFLSFSLLLSRTHTHTLSRTHTHTHSLSLFLSFSHSLSFFFSLSLSLDLSHSSLTRTHSLRSGARGVGDPSALSTPVGGRDAKECAGKGFDRQEF